MSSLGHQVSDEDELLELNYLLNDSNDGNDQGFMSSARGSNQPVFEVYYKAVGAKSTKVRIFHVPHRLLKLQHTKDTSEVFASKMQ